MKALLSFLTVLVFISCKKTVDSNPVELPAKTVYNLSYGSDPAQVLDMYLPAGRNTVTTPLLILIHAGAWTSGDKKDLGIFVNSLQQRLPGYAIANINYRLATATTNHFPTQENDVHAAIEYLIRTKDDHAFSSDFVLMGASAGGHLALLHSYKYKAPVPVKAVVSFFGPTDISEMYNSPESMIGNSIRLLLGGTPETKAAAYAASSPITFANENSCATMLLHGGADPIVPATQAVALKNKLESAGATVEYLFYPSEGHGWMGATLNDSFDKVAAFIKKQVD